MITMTIKNIIKEEIMNEVINAYWLNKKICVVKGNCSVAYQMINKEKCMVTCTYFGKCDYRFPEPISVSKFADIFSNENIKYGYVIYIGSGYLGNENMSVEQELHLKSEYLSN